MKQFIIFMGCLLMMVPTILISTDFGDGSVANEAIKRDCEEVAKAAITYLSNTEVNLSYSDGAYVADTDAIMDFVKDEINDGLLGVNKEDYIIEVIACEYMPKQSVGAVVQYPLGRLVASRWATDDYGEELTLKETKTLDISNELTVSASPDMYESLDISIEALGTNNVSVGCGDIIVSIQKRVDYFGQSEKTLLRSSKYSIDGHGLTTYNSKVVIDGNTI